MFKAGENYPTRTSFANYCISLLEIRDFDALIKNKPFFDQHIKSKQGAYEKLVEMSKNNDYITEQVLDYSVHQNYSKFIGIDL